MAEALPPARRSHEARGWGRSAVCSVNGEWVYARLNGEIIAVSRHEARAAASWNAAP